MGAGARRVVAMVCSPCRSDGLFTVSWRWFVHPHQGMELAGRGGEKNNCVEFHRGACKEAILRANSRLSEQNFPVSNFKIPFTSTSTFMLQNLGKKGEKKKQQLHRFKCKSLILVRRRGRKHCFGGSLLKKQAPKRNGRNIQGPEADEAAHVAECERGWEVAAGVQPRP